MALRTQIRVERRDNAGRQVVFSCPNGDARRQRDHRFVADVLVDEIGDLPQRGDVDVAFEPQAGKGFGQRFVDSTNTNTVGTITISANQISRYITFSVDKAALGGTPASGWIFTVVLTGQDGFSSDQARGFQPTPQPFQFGVCATVLTR